MKILKDVKITQSDFARKTDKVIENASKPCNQRDLSCTGMTSYAPPR